MVALSRQNLSQSIGTPIVALLCVVAIELLQVPQLNKLTYKAKTASLENLKREVESEKLRLIY